MKIKADTSLYVGPGVRVEGRITQDNKNETIVIAGLFAGDIITQGRVVVDTDGKIEAANEIRCFDLEVAGSVEGADVLVEAGILRLVSTARMSVGEISLPPGGLEQTRGSVLSGKLRMEESNSFSSDDRLNPPSPPIDLDVAEDRSSRSASILSSLTTKQESEPAATPSTEESSSSGGVAGEFVPVAHQGRMPAFLAAAIGRAGAARKPMDLTSDQVNPTGSTGSKEEAESTFDDPDIEPSPSARY